MFAGTLFVTTEGKLIYSLPGSSEPLARIRERRRGEGGAIGGATDIRLVATNHLHPDSGAIVGQSTLAPAGEGTRPAAGKVATPLTLTESFVTREGKALPATPQGYRPAVSTVSYFIGGDTSKHQSNVNTYERVNLGNVFPGINVQLRATGSNVEKIFTVAPHQDPKQIQVKVDGANKLEIGAKGELIAHTEHGPVTYTAPIAFQEDASGTQAPVEVRYTLVQHADDHTSPHTRYAFALGAYDEAKPLTIDPLLQSTYLGGSGSEFAYAVAIHPHSGDVYVTGATDSTNFPALTGGADSSSNGQRDVFVSRFSGDLKRLIQSTVIGAAGDEFAYAMAIHPVSGDVYVAGATESTSGFPGLGGAAQSTHGGGRLDAFVSRLSADLKTLHRSSYLGGSSNDTAYALTIHPVTGAVYVAGTTLSGNFPGTLGGAQAAYGGSTIPVEGDAFVSAFSADLGTRMQSTYLGGAGSDSAKAIAIHPATGEVYVAGGTASTTFPIGSGNHAQAALNDPQDAFVVRLDAALTSVRGGTFLGGAADEAATALVIDTPTGDVILVGSTGPGGSGQPLPGLTGAAQPTNGGGYDGFVSRLSRDLSTVLQSTYLT